MASKAVWAALMGGGQGLAQYGGWRAQDALSSMREDRTFDRQKSLMEIRQRYQERMRDEQRAYDLRKLTPGTQEYDLSETQRQKERTEGLTDAKKLIEARGDAYGYGSRGNKVLSALNPASFTTESWTPFITEYNRMVDSGVSDQEAIRRAMETAPLQLKPTSRAGVDQAAVRSANEAVAVAMEESPEYLRDMLMEMGYNEQRLANMSKFQLLQLYRAKMLEMFGTSTPGQQGLMGGAPGMENDLMGNDPLGLFE